MELNGGCGIYKLSHFKGIYLKMFFAYFHKCHPVGFLFDAKPISDVLVSNYCNKGHIEGIE